MGPVIGDILPLALGIAISPIPIIAAILMLFSPAARSTSLGFLAGWVVGVAGAVTIFTLLASFIQVDDPDAAHPVVGVIQIVLGLALLFLAARQWRGRPVADAAPVLPKWMSAIDTMTPGRALALGLVLAAVNPKNLAMAIAAGVTVGTALDTASGSGAGSGAPSGTATLTAGSATVVLIVFTMLAVSTVLVPVVGYLIAAERMRGPLDRLREWLVHNNAAVMSVLLLVIGVVLLGKGIGSF